MTLKYLKSSSKKCSKDTKKNNSFWLVWKRQQRPVMSSVQLRRQEKKPRPKQERRPRNRELQKRRRRKNRWSISNDYRTRNQQRILPFWRVPNVPRSQKLNTGKSPQRMRRSNSLSRKQKKNNQQGTIRTSGLRQEVLTSVRGMCTPGRITWYIIQDE